MRQRRRGVAEVQTLDHAEIHAPEGRLTAVPAHPVGRARRLSLLGALLISICTTIACATAGVIAYGIVQAWLAAYGWLINILLTAVVIVVAGAVIALVVSAAAQLAALLAARVRQVDLTRLPGGMPISSRDVAQGWQRGPARQIAEWAMAQHYHTEQEYARHSGLQGVHTYSVQTAAPPRLAEPRGALPLPPAEGGDPDGSLVTLLSRGHIRRSGRSWLIGYDDAGVPQYLDWGESPLTAIAGNSNMGKSALARLFLAQAAISPGEPIGVVLIDPHGNHEEKSLARSCRGLEPTYLRPVAISVAQILESLRAVRAILRARKQAEASDRSHVLLVIDEFNLLMDGDAFPHQDEAASILVEIAREGNKYHVRALVIMHTLTADTAGGSALRDQVAAKVVFNLAPNQSRLLIRDADNARVAAGLMKGQALAIRGLGAPTVRVNVPLVRRDDLALVAGIVNRRDPPLAAEPELSAGQPTIDLRGAGDHHTADVGSEDIEVVRQIARDVVRKRREAPEAPLATLISKGDHYLLRREIQRVERALPTKTQRIRYLWQSRGGDIFAIAARIYDELTTTEAGEVV